MRALGLQGPVSKRGGLRPLRHAVFGAVGASKNETAIRCAHFDVANTTWGSQGTVTTLALLSVRATYGPLSAPV